MTGAGVGGAVVRPVRSSSWERQAPRTLSPLPPLKPQVIGRPCLLPLVRGAGVEEALDVASALQLGLLAAPARRRVVRLLQAGTGGWAAGLGSIGIRRDSEPDRAGGGWRWHPPWPP